MAKTTQRGLGRGLGALFSDAGTPEEPLSAQAPENLLPIQKIEPNPDQPRRAFDEEQLAVLADSIREHGLIQPITVRKLPTGFYQIIAGERRWRAARLAGLREIPALVIEADDKKAAELALVENLQREDLNPIEEAQGYQTLMDRFSMTQEEAAGRVGKSRPAVANALRLLALPADILKKVEEGQLSAGHARALLPLHGTAQGKAAAQVIAQQLSVRQTEALVKRLQKPAKEPAQRDPLAVDYYRECELALTRQLGRKVSIVHGKGKGRFELEYYDDDDLLRLVEALESIQAEDGTP